MPNQHVSDIRIIVRNDTEENWNANNPVLLKCEMGVESGPPGRFKFGDGTTNWKDLAYAGEGYFADYQEFKDHKESPTHYYERSAELSGADAIIVRDGSGVIPYTELKKLRFGVYHLTDVNYVPSTELTSYVCSDLIVSVHQTGENAVMTFFDTELQKNGVITFDVDNGYNYVYNMDSGTTLTAALSSATNGSKNHNIRHMESEASTKANYKLHGYTEVSGNLAPFLFKTLEASTSSNQTLLEKQFGTTMSTTVENMTYDYSATIYKTCSFFSDVYKVGNTKESGVVFSLHDQVTAINTFVFDAVLDPNLIYTAFVGMMKTMMMTGMTEEQCLDGLKSSFSLTDADVVGGIYGSAFRNALLTRTPDKIDAFILNTENIMDLAKPIDELYAMSAAHQTINTPTYENPAKLHLEFVTEPGKYVFFCMKSTYSHLPSDADMANFPSGVHLYTAFGDPIFCDKSVYDNSMNQPWNNVITAENNYTDFASVRGDTLIYNSNAGYFPLFRGMTKDMLDYWGEIYAGNTDTMPGEVYALGSYYDAYHSEATALPIVSQGRTITGDTTAFDFTYNHTGYTVSTTDTPKDKTFLTLISSVQIPSGRYTVSMDISVTGPENMGSGLVELCFDAPHYEHTKPPIVIFPENSIGHCSAVVDFPEESNYKAAYIRLYAATMPVSSPVTVSFQNMRLEAGNLLKERETTIPIPNDYNINVESLKLPEENLICPDMGVYKLTPAIGAIENGVLEVKTGAASQAYAEFYKSAADSGIAGDTAKLFPQCAFRAKDITQPFKHPGFTVNGLDPEQTYTLVVSGDKKKTNIIGYNSHNRPLPSYPIEAQFLYPNEISLISSSLSARMIIVSGTTSVTVLNVLPAPITEHITLHCQMSLDSDIHTIMEYGFKFDIDNQPLGFTGIKQSMPLRSIGNTVKDCYDSSSNRIELNTKVVNVYDIVAHNIASLEDPFAGELLPGVTFRHYNAEAYPGIMEITITNTDICKWLCTGVDVDKVNRGEFKAIGHACSYNNWTAYRNTNFVALHMSDTLVKCLFAADYSVYYSQAQIVPFPRVFNARCIVPRNKPVYLDNPMVNNGVPIRAGMNDIMVATKLLVGDHQTSSVIPVSALPCTCDDALTFSVPTIGQAAVIMLGDTPINPTTTTDLVYDPETGKNISATLRGKLDKAGGEISGDLNVTGLLSRDGAEVYDASRPPIVITDKTSAEIPSANMPLNTIVLETVSAASDSEYNPREVRVAEVAIGEEYIIQPSATNVLVQLTGSKLTLIASGSGDDVTIKNVVSATIAQNNKAAPYISNIVAHCWYTENGEDRTSTVSVPGMFDSVSVAESARVIDGVQINTDTAKVISFKK